VKPINQLRQLHGDYETLFQELKNDENLFFRYTRMSLPLFNKLVQLTNSHLRKNSYRALSTKQRLIIALRYLVTGYLPLSIALAFRVGESTVRILIKEICQVLINNVLLRKSFFNYKKYYSIVLMAVTNHVYRFTLIDVGAYGGNSDGGIFNESLIGENLKNENLGLPKELFSYQAVRNVHQFFC
ncbi:hypothetical protein ALC62_14803, partial [Cyphomyrmex costatus]